MDRHEYANEDESGRDMNQIFTNCYTYWSKKDSHVGRVREALEVVRGQVLEHESLDSQDGGG